MSFAGMASQLLGEPVELAAWGGPVLVHLLDRKKPTAQSQSVERSLKRKPRKATKRPQEHRNRPR